MPASNDRPVSAFHFLRNCLSGAQVALRCTNCGAIVHHRVQSATTSATLDKERPQPAAGRQLHNPPPFNYRG